MPSSVIGGGARGGSAGSTCTRSSTAARASPTRRSTTTTNGDRHRVHPPGLRLVPGAIVVERLMTDNHFSYTKSTAPADLLDHRAISHLTIRPSRRGPTEKNRALPPDPDAGVGLRARIRLDDADARCCHTGSTTTASGAPIRHSATDLPGARVREVLGLEG
jgi:hypothetical protein